MFERFTERAKRCLVLAEQECQKLGHGEIGTEHMLVALAAEGPEGVAARALADVGFDLERGRHSTAELHAGTSARSTKRPFTSAAKRALVASLGEALAMGHNHIGTEHLLLGVLRVPDGGALPVLAGQGITAEAVEEAVMTRLGQPR